MMNNYIKYTFYDENNKLIAIVSQNITKEAMQDLKKRYDEVKFKE